MNKPMTQRYSPEVRARAVRTVLEHEAQYPSRWAALSSIAGKIGCTAETLRLWLKRAERESGARAVLKSPTAYQTLERSVPPLISLCS